ncbi:short transient receptor potential channel 4-like [Uloborus diversus]|uniref:short transient receptor potential channel 4-like n=1 Tax=Uloborus diversus TaxID=327109 RepID=UPI002409CA1C|nr:short transient receptor potential channel 4-like [Uloborus diversus]
MTVTHDPSYAMCDDCPIGLVQQRSSHVEDYLSEQEQEFLYLVSIGDKDGIKTLLEAKQINPNCSDYRDQRALDIAVGLRDLDLVLFLLQQLDVSTLHYYCAILRAVLENEVAILEMLLDRAEADNNLQNELRDFMIGGPECKKCLPDVAVTNLTPTMAAAVSGNVEVTRILLERGYCIQKPHSAKCKCREACASRNNTGETLTESMNRVNAYRALASPTYLILTAEDPILAAFQLSQELDNLSLELAENQKEYRELSNQCRRFAADMLHQCRNTEEVQTVLIQKRGFTDPRPHQFSRLHLAVELQQKEFVTHASCQQVLRSMWVDSLGSWYSWPLRWRALHVLKHVLFTPFISVAFIIIPKSQIIRPLRVPLNRFIYSATSYLFFLCLLMVTLLNDRRHDVRSPVSWTEGAVCLCVLGHSWDIITNMISVGVSHYFRSWWSVYDTILFSLFLITEIMWFSVFILNFFHPTITNSSRDCWEWYHPILLGEGIYATASIMAFCRLMIWFQVNSRLGPLGTSVKEMIVNVAQFFMLFFIIMLAFATGLNSIYKNYKEDPSMGVEESDDNNGERQPSDFVTLRSTFKTLFWAIFGMGEPDFAQIVVASRNESEPKEHLFTEGVGYSLWGFYHMVTVVVLLNMLIAMMTESYQNIQTNADMEWKFACSTLWLTVLDNHSVVPPPFNLVPSMHRLTLLCRWSVGKLTGLDDANTPKLSWSAKRCCYWDMEIDSTIQKIEEEKYEKLLVQLIRRYLHGNCLQAIQTSKPFLSTDFKEKLKEEIVQDLQHSIKRPTRYTRRKRIPNITSSPSEAKNRLKK